MFASKRPLDFFDKLILLHSGFMMQLGWAMLNMGTLFSIILILIARRDPELWYMYLVLLLPIIGLFIIIRNYPKNAFKIKLLVSGEIGWGRINQRTPTDINFQINRTNYPVIEYALSIKDSFGQNQLIRSTTYLPIVENEEGLVLVIYPKDNPASGQLYDSIPNAPVLRSDGQFESLSLIKIRSLILPILFFVLFGKIIFNFIIGSLLLWLF